MVATAEERAEMCVERGAAWLDEVQPDWVDRVTKEIDMWSPDRCVAGQALAHRPSDCTCCANTGYSTAWHMLGDKYLDGVDAHGFNETENSYVKDAWMALIAKRREVEGTA